MKIGGVAWKDYGNCPWCDLPLAYREGKYGPFISCTGFPKCDYKTTTEKARAVQLGYDDPRDYGYADHDHDLGDPYGLLPPFDD